MVIQILEWAIIIRCFLSWIPHNPANTIIKMIYDITEPILKPFRNIRIGGPNMMLDLSPIFAVFSMMLIRSFVLAPIFNFIAELIR